MKKQKPSDLIKSIFARYILLLALAVFMLFYSGFYHFFLKLTIYPVSWLLSLFYDSFVYGNKILVATVGIEIIPACVAVSAYLLLLILNLTTAMSPKQRVYSLFFSFAALLAANIVRIFILSVFLIKDVAYFEIVHRIFWYSLSIIIVVAVWFLSVYLFKIKEIPVYSDFKKVFSLLNKKGK